MRPNQIIKSRQDCSDRLHEIGDRMAVCSEDQEKQFWACVLEFGQWLVDVEKRGMPWSVGYLSKLQDLMTKWQFVKGEKAASLQARLEIHRLLQELIRVDRYAARRFVHPYRRPRAKRTLAISSGRSV